MKKRKVKYTSEPIGKIKIIDDFLPRPKDLVLKEETTKRATFIFRGLGFPIKLINVPMRKMVGEWTLDVNFNKFQLAVLDCLLHKPAPLTGDELRFIRKFLKMSTTDFGKIFGVTHVTVVKWESGQTRANLSTDVLTLLPGKGEDLFEGCFAEF